MLFDDCDNTERKNVWNFTDMYTDVDTGYDICFLMYVLLFCLGFQAKDARYVHWISSTVDQLV